MLEAVHIIESHDNNYDLYYASLKNKKEHAMQALK